MNKKQKIKHDFINKDLIKLIFNLKILPIELLINVMSFLISDIENINDIIKNNYTTENMFILLSYNKLINILSISYKNDYYIKENTGLRTKNELFNNIIIIKKEIINRLLQENERYLIELKTTTYSCSRMYLFYIIFCFLLSDNLDTIALYTTNRRQANSFAGGLRLLIPKIYPQLHLFESNCAYIKLKYGNNEKIILFVQNYASYWNDKNKKMIQEVDLLLIACVTRPSDCNFINLLIEYLEQKQYPKYKRLIGVEENIDSHIYGDNVRENLEEILEDILS